MNYSYTLVSRTTKRLNHKRRTYFNTYAPNEPKDLDKTVFNHRWKSVLGLHYDVNPIIVRQWAKGFEVFRVTAYMNYRIMEVYYANHGNDRRLREEWAKCYCPSKMVK